ncbi:hypothetical protein F8M41_016349 [Gigaspora margarita]|uniref:Uncharacterized protein n=1 Tax=Gigaspora margarita TaxID=4874 RepID=A0A8H3WVT7_GIGMA|nr:hypothetical protein F8M41_016349 [Gigaspora margarita]
MMNSPPTMNSAPKTDYPPTTNSPPTMNSLPMTNSRPTAHQHDKISKTCGTPERQGKKNRNLKENLHEDVTGHPRKIY